MARPSEMVETIKQLLGFSAYEGKIYPQYTLSLDSRTVVQTREALGGQIQPIPSTQLRWYLADLEYSQAQCDIGNMVTMGQLYRAMRRDGNLLGLLETRTGGLVRLPKRFFGGDTNIINSLRDNNATRSVFEEMCPPGELEALDADGIVAGVGVGELIPVEGRKYPVLCRLDPEWLTFNWADSSWYYNSRAGRIKITPGDGRWVLHIPKGRIAPWQWGQWAALGRAFIMKEHAVSLRGAFIAGVANPAKVMQAPRGATESERGRMFQHLLNWGPNMAVELPPGWEMKLLEFMGRSHEVFQREIDTCNECYMVSLAGQVVSTIGGSGFQDTKLPASIRADLIKKDGEALAYTVNTQIIPWYVYHNFGEAAVNAGTGVEWDTATPQDQTATANMMIAVGNAIEKLGKEVPNFDRQEFAKRFGVPITDEIKTDDPLQRPREDLGGEKAGGVEAPNDTKEDGSPKRGPKEKLRAV